MCFNRKPKPESPDKKKKTPKSTQKEPALKTALDDQMDDKENKAGDPAAQQKKNSGENMMAKPFEGGAMQDKKKEPLHIKVPPPRVMTAKRKMKETKEARDPEYKTLELDISEWESVTIMKRSDIKNEDIVKKQFKEGKEGVPEKREKEAVEAAA